MANIVNRFFENMSQFKYLRTSVMNQNMIQEEIKRKLNLGNACFHSVQNLQSSLLLFKNKNCNMKDSYFACNSEWVWNLTSMQIVYFGW
jgi:hypothetical protein